MTRPDRDEYFLNIVDVVATRSTCTRRQVGCVLVDENRHILSTGYNGTPRGMAHCLVTPCAGANARSGYDLDKCFAVHAEANALIQCPDTEKIFSIYASCSPCVHCFKMLMNTSAKRIVFRSEYSGWQELSYLWTRSGREVICA